jgi:hypothetical protein
MTIRNLDSETLNHFTVLKEVVTNDHSSHIFLENHQRLVIMEKLEGIRCEICGNVAICYAVDKQRFIFYFGIVTVQTSAAVIRTAICFGEK